MLVNPDLGRAGQSPAERGFPGPLPHPYPRIGIPTLEQRAGLRLTLGPEHTEVALAGQVKAGMHGGRNGHRQCDSAAQAKATDLIAVPDDNPAHAGREGCDP